MDWDSELDWSLNKKTIPDKLKKKIENKGFSFPTKSDFTREGDKWVITDNKILFEKKIIDANSYILRKVGEELCIYKKESLSSFRENFIEYYPNLKGDTRLKYIQTFYDRHGNEYEREVEALCKGFGELIENNEKKEIYSFYFRVCAVDDG